MKNKKNSFDFIIYPAATGTSTCKTRLNIIIRIYANYILRLYILIHYTIYTLIFILDLAEWWVRRIINCRVRWITSWISRRVRLRIICRIRLIIWSITVSMQWWCFVLMMLHSFLTWAIAYGIKLNCLYLVCYSRWLASWILLVD